MLVIPVLDVQQGLVVRGIAGRRAEYRAIASPIAADPDPLAVARSFRKHLDSSTLYLADLDAIVHRRRNLPLYRDLSADGNHLWVDAGVRTAEEASRLLAEALLARVVMGLETLESPDELSRLSASDRRRVVFSLDMKDGKPLTAIESWKTVEPWVIVECVYRAGLRSILLLDLARVGMNEGIGTEELLRRLQETYPDMDVIVGGGIRHPQDLDQAAGLGARAALVASALHDGSITVQDIQRARTLGRPMSCP